MQTVGTGKSDVRGEIVVHIYEMMMISGECGVQHAVSTLQKLSQFSIPSWVFLYTSFLHLFSMSLIYNVRNGVSSGEECCGGERKVSFTTTLEYMYIHSVDHHLNAYNFRPNISLQK